LPQKPTNKTRFELQHGFGAFSLLQQPTNNVRFELQHGFEVFKRHWKQLFKIRAGSDTGSIAILRDVFLNKVNKDNMTKEYVAQLEQLIISGNEDLAIQLAKSINIDIADVYSVILKKIGLPLQFEGCATAEEIVTRFLEESYFYCHNNQLTTLDVSCNTALESLDCDNNQLTKLDLSCNTALEELDCNNNQLTTLDVSRNTALNRLDCSNNQLTTLDVSRNTALERLYCNNNQLTAIDVSRNTALEYLFCYNNQLTAIDVSRNTALEVLYCEFNQLTTLDVSCNTALRYLIAIGNNFSKAEQARIQETLPSCKMFF